MNKIKVKSLIAAIIIIFALASGAFAATGTVEQYGPQYRYASQPSQKEFISRTTSKDSLVANATAGVIQGVDSNPLLDSTHKADCYTQEMVDMHFKYPILKNSLGPVNSRFGFNVTNVGYYNITDVSTLDSVIDASIEQEVYKDLTLTAGYLFETLYFPHDSDGTFNKNEINASLKHKISGRIYQSFTNRLQFRDYMHKKVLFGNGVLGSELRHDVREVLEHQIWAYPGKNTKVKVVNQVYFNYSNYQYLDYYDFLNYKLGGVVTHFFTKKLSAVTGVYYQRRNYDSRTCSDKEKHQKDDLYMVTASFLYDISRNASVFVNYTYNENSSNEPLERYTDNLYTAGLYYSF